MALGLAPTPAGDIECPAGQARAVYPQGVKIALLSFLSGYFDTEIHRLRLRPGSATSKRSGREGREAMLQYLRDREAFTRRMDERPSGRKDETDETA